MKIGDVKVQTNNSDIIRNWFADNERNVEIP